MPVIIAGSRRGRAKQRRRVGEVLVLAANRGAARDERRRQMRRGKGSHMNIVSLGTSPNVDPLVQTIVEHDLERNIVELDAYGFTVIPPEKLGTPPGFADRLREAILGVYTRRHDVEIDDHRTADLPTPNRRYKQLIDEDDAITEAALNPVTLAMARWHCGQSAILGVTSSIIKPPGAEHRLPLHNDTHGVPPPQAAYPHFVNTSWVLTDYDGIDDGPTVFVPGSHRWGRVPTPQESEFWREGAPIEPVPLQAKAGSLAVWGGNMWHGAVPRTTPGLRVTLVLGWARPYMKTVHMWQFGGISPERVERYPELTAILGLTHHYPQGDERPEGRPVEPFIAAGQDQFA